MTSHALNLTILLIASCLLVVGPSLRAQSYESTVETKFYKPGSNARAVFASGLSSAISTNNYLMVVFGADWCPDCRKLYENLASEEVASYMDDHMNFVTIDVGRKDLNIDLAAELGWRLAPQTWQPGVGPPRRVVAEEHQVRAAHEPGS